MKFTPRSESTRQFIIETCAPVFNQKGFAGTSITDLEKVTKLSKGSIYGNFENKDAVAIAVFEYNLENKLGLIRRWEDRAATFKGKLLAHIHIHYPNAETLFTAGGCPIQNTAIEADDTHEILREKAAAGLIRLQKGMEKLIKEGISAGEFYMDTRPLETALHIISLIEGAAMTAKLTKDMSLAVTLLAIAEKTVEAISK